jgi:hypothetical protein
MVDCLIKSNETGTISGLVDNLTAQAAGNDTGRAGRAVDPFDGCIAIRIT